LVLAYLGDAVWELKVREYLILKSYKIHKTNLLAKQMVNAKIQSKIFKEIYEELPQDYKEIVKRAKNSNIKTFPKSCTVMEYKEATAFEALIAIYYQNGELAEIENLIKKVEGEK
ncbi:MAG: ribonuclease III domain-containing protein, partial [Fusobacteriaceae bacterium]